MEFLKTAVNETVCLIVAAIAEQASYPFQIKDKLRDLKSATGDLEAMKEDVKTSIVNAERENRAPTKQVEEWLNKAEAIKKEAEEIPKEFDKCRRFMIWSNYAIGRNAMKKLDEVRRLCNQRTTIAVTMHLPSPLTQEMPTSSSKLPMLELALQCIKDDAHDIIGICGIFGVGKTHLLKQINNELCKDCSFDAVIFLTCSKECSEEKIQNQIIHKLGLNYGNNYIEQKQITIFNFLRKRSFAILLDDIVSVVDLESIGIPNYRSSNRAGKCKGKVVLTTRSPELCGLMEVQKTITLDVMNWDAAWNLFTEKVTDETIKSHPLIRQYAVEIVKKLGGVPSAIIAVGRAMRAQTDPSEWKLAVELLKQVRLCNVELDKQGRLHELLQKARL